MALRFVYRYQEWKQIDAMPRGVLLKIAGFVAVAGAAAEIF